MGSTDETQTSTNTAQVAASNLHDNNLTDASYTPPTSSTTNPLSASNLVEMTDLSTQSATQDESSRPLSHQATFPDSFQESREDEKSHTGVQVPALKIEGEGASSTQAMSSGDQNSKPPPLGREQTHPAIGAATDQPTPNLNASEIEAATLMITLLLHTGARHPYKIDEKYLRKRNVSVADNNPINMSVYTLKELIWRDWREEWDPRPASPSSIRLIHFGKLLDDKAHLKDGRFSIGDTPHVVHMTVKPQEVVDDEDARIAKGGTRDRDGNERSPGCRCVIQ